jgi:hypothetical protein
VVAIHRDVGCECWEGGFWSIEGRGQGVEVLGNGFCEGCFSLGILLAISVTGGFRGEYQSLGCRIWLLGDVEFGEWIGILLYVVVSHFRAIEKV